MLYLIPIIVFVSTAENTFSFRFKKIKTSVFFCFVANLALARHGTNDEFWKVETSEFLDKKVGMSNCMKGLCCLDRSQCFVSRLPEIVLETDPPKRQEVIKLVEERSRKYFVKMIFLFLKSN